MEHVRCVHTNIEISKLGREGGEFAATAHADRDGKPKKQKKKGRGWLGGKINEKKTASSASRIMVRSHSM